MARTARPHPIPASGRRRGQAQPDSCPVNAEEPVPRRCRGACGAKVTSIVGGMIAGANSIDDTRHPPPRRDGALFAGPRPPPLGTFLRGFTFGRVRQLESASRTVTLQDQLETLLGVPVDLVPKEGLHLGSSATASTQRRRCCMPRDELYLAELVKQSFDDL